MAKDKEKIKGGLAQGMDAEDLAKKHGVTVKVINSKLKKGVKVEMEHTTDKDVAYEIAKDHVFENINYYEELAKIEATNESYEKKIITKLLRESLNEMDGNKKIHNLYKSDRLIGKLVLRQNEQFGKYTITIQEVNIKPDYLDLNMMTKVIRKIWLNYPDIRRIIVDPLINEEFLWEKLNFIRLNNSYLYLMR